MSDLTQNNAKKFIRFVRYLHALSTINTKTVRTLEDYIKVFWLPLDSSALGCEQDNSDDFLWFQVEKTDKPPLPQPPKGCRKWIEQEDLYNLNAVPELGLPVEFAHTTPAALKALGEETLYPDAFARREQQWQDYIEQQWKPWRQQCQRLLSQKKITTDLFRLYQEQQKFGEQYELLLSFGLLSWKTQDRQIVQRHLIVTEATISFDQASKRLTVYQTLPTAKVELDMLSPEEQSQKFHEMIQNSCQELEGNLHKKKVIDSVLNNLAQALSDDPPGQYYPDRLQPTQHPPTSQPIIAYAPALIMRKRSMRPLEGFLDKVLDLHAPGVRIPEEFLHLCEILPEEVTTHREETTQKLSDSTILFPLPSNREQRRIVKKLNKKKGVLIQGPPGTGKSHTIANLICHLLAQGKRVLVTAQTARALQVLHELLPENIRPLCFNATEQDKQEQVELEQKIRAILTEEKIRQTAEDDHIQELEQRLQVKQQAKQATDIKILNLREREVQQHRVGQGRYCGTAARIAEQVRRDAPDFSWLSDSIAHDTPLPWSEQHILFLRRILRTSDLRTEKKLTGKELPQLEKKFPVHKVKDAFEKEEQARQAANLEKKRLQ
ncbi:MAG: hypothetical protein D3910_09030, partial [Candidatus Electrothrix sp. ATG2]|nr:hypothetical protein [Candidatus Electrothrix sp. ATG2]